MIENEGLIIDPEKVEKAFLDCLFKNEELDKTHTKVLSGKFIPVEGIINSVAFHPERLESKRKQVEEWLNALPIEFRKDNGGGWSFLNACNQANGIQWTGLQQRMEQLMMIGIGLGLVDYVMPRELWNILPGGVPYFVIVGDNGQLETGPRF